ncbi:MAG TPA: sigma-54 dependent transcriptional regulator [Actinomycetota bacterium]
MERPLVLVVHADAAVRVLLDHMLPSFGYGIRSATSGEEAIDQLAGGEVTVVLLDLDLPGLSGADTLRAIRAMSPAPEVVVTSAHGTVTEAADVARHGAFDFVPQPFDFKDLNHILRAAHEQALRRRQTLHLEAALRAHDPFPEIVGRSQGIKRVLALVNKAARTLSPVLIQGESGTGKELVARALHANSPRANSLLTIVDCGALQDTLLESELFGHERGAFTGAHGLKHGLLETANQGTLFLDEIGEMSPATQVKVLRALQSGEFRRIGSNRQIKADIRVIAATNKDLREEGRQGRFREDLYYRIAVIEIHMPPLRERTEDIPFLVEHFLRVNAYGGRERLQVTSEAMACLVRYSWPGNIRELRNVIERLSVLADSQVLTVDTLPPAIAKAGLEPAEPPGSPRLDTSRGDGMADLTLDEIERHHIMRTLERHRWNKKRAAGILGIDTKTLYNKLRRYGVPIGTRGDGDAGVPPA